MMSGVNQKNLNLLMYAYFLKGTQCMCILIFHICRRVHITQATVDKLHNKFRISPHLSHPIQTYLIVDDEVKCFTERAHHYFPNQVQSTILPSYSSLTISSVGDSLHPSLSALSVSSLTQLTRTNQPASRTISPKYTECWGADKPFANISQNRMAKTIGMAVGSFDFIFHSLSDWCQARLLQAFCFD